MLRRRTGVTFMELLVVLIIIGVLAVIAIPTFTKRTEQGYFAEAENLLLAIYSGQRAYFFLNNFYFDNPSTSDEWRLIHMDDPNVMSGLPVTFSVGAPAGGGPPTFTATATRNGAPCNTQTLTINEARTTSGGWEACKNNP